MDIVQRICPYHEELHKNMYRSEARMVGTLDVDGYIGQLYAYYSLRAKVKKTQFVIHHV